MIRETFPVPPLGCNCTILGEAGEAIVVDPGGDIPRIIATLTKHTLTVKAIVITHAHIDHIGAALSLKRLTGAPILYNQKDVPQLAIMAEQAGWFGLPTPDTAPPDADATDGMKLKIGETEAVILHTPGHTEGSLVIHIPTEKLLLAGDTLFAGSIGRTDFPGGDFAKIMASIKGTLMALPEDTLVIAGHGPSTGIGEEAQSNPFIY